MQNGCLNEVLIKYIEKQKLLAHNNGVKQETLTDHINQTEKYLNYLLENDNLFTKEEKNILIDMFKLHDLGKININYQKYIKGENLTNKSLKNHSELSFFLLFLIFFNNEKDINNFVKLTSNYCVLKHHSNLKNICNSDNFYEYLKLLNNEYKQEKFKNILQNKNLDFFEFVKKKYKNLKIKEKDNKFFLIEKMFKIYANIDNYITDKQLLNVINTKFEEFIDILVNNEYKTEKNYDLIQKFIYTKYLFSILIVADIYATISAELDYKDLIHTNQNAIKKINKKINDILNRKNKEKINELRTNISNIVYSNLKNNIDKNIFLIEMATGTGKTLTALRTTNVKNFNKIFYVLHYNTLLEQTAKVFEDIGLKENEDFIVINSETFMDLEENEDENKLKLLKNKIYDAKIILTTTVNFFNILFSNKKKNILNYFNLSNSLIILDEIQTIPYEMFPVFLNILNNLGNLLGTKSILMSATIPIEIIENTIDKKYTQRLFKISDIEDEKFKEEYKNLFENRVNIKLLNEENYKYNMQETTLIEDIIEKINIHNKNKILIEFITKKNASIFYNMIKNNNEISSEYQIYFLNSNVNKIKREEIINSIKKSNNKIILISTQVIEAGVDIDMDLGFKEFGTIETEIQFLGRINRNAQKENCYAYFFKTNTKTNLVYNDKKINYFTLDYLDKNEIEKLQNSEILDKIYKIFKEKYLNIKNNKYILSEDLEKISNTFKLIEDKNIKIFVPINIEVEKDNQSFYKIKDIIEKLSNVVDINFYDINNNNLVLNGNKLLDNYTEILFSNDIEYTKKQIIKKNLNILLNLFIINYYYNPKILWKFKPYFKENEIFDFFIVDEKYVNDIFDFDTYSLDIEKSDSLFI